MADVSIFIALGAGLVSFFSPCILPLLPVYISFITGLSLEELKNVEDKKKRFKNVLIRMSAFVLGFSIIFIILGASASVVGNIILKNKELIRVIGGLVIIIFGLQVSGLARIKLLQSEKRPDMAKYGAGVFGPFIIGLVFGLGWTPCIGPILGSILTIAAAKQSVAQGIILLSFYSVGLAFPFIISGLFLDWVLVRMIKIHKYLKWISLFSGILLIVIGILLIFGKIF
ncbi:MAG: cytochrome c biogenesis protein CcdA [Elusimicrobiota bacterium]